MARLVSLHISSASLQEPTNALPKIRVDLFVGHAIVAPESRCRRLHDNVSKHATTFTSIPAGDQDNHVVRFRAGASMHTDTQVELSSNTHIGNVHAACLALQLDHLYSQSDNIVVFRLGQSPSDTRTAVKVFRIFVLEMPTSASRFQRRTKKAHRVKIQYRRDLL